tara:strand:- start:740 stop:1249 length:510 start_codon:yes stop_codon:yes gene_type:complete
MSSEEVAAVTTDTPASNNGMTPESINLLISGVQSAAMVKDTRFPEQRDPETTTHITTQPSARVHFVPEPEKIGYIEEDDNVSEKDFDKGEKIVTTAPVGIAMVYRAPILYILFMIVFNPKVWRGLFNIAPFLSSDGYIPNAYGTMVIGILFTIIYLWVEGVAVPWLMTD